MPDSAQSGPCKRGRAEQCWTRGKIGGSSLANTSLNVAGWRILCLRSWNGKFPQAPALLTTPSVGSGDIGVPTILCTGRATAGPPRPASRESHPAVRSPGPGPPPGAWRCEWVLTCPPGPTLRLNLVPSRELRVGSREALAGRIRFLPQAHPAAPGPPPLPPRPSRHGRWG